MLHNTATTLTNKDNVTPAVSRFFFPFSPSPLLFNQFTPENKVGSPNRMLFEYNFFYFLQKEQRRFVDVEMVVANVERERETSSSVIFSTFKMLLVTVLSVIRTVRMSHIVCVCALGLSIKPPIWYTRTQCGRDAMKNKEEN